MKINETELISKIADSAVKETIPDWLKIVERITENVSGMLNTYQSMKGGTQTNEPRKIIASQPYETPTPAPNTEVKELLSGLLKTCNTLISLGYGDKSIGDVLVSAPYTIKQVTVFLNTFYNKKYGT